MNEKPSSDLASHPLRESTESLLSSPQAISANVSRAAFFRLIAAAAIVLLVMLGSAALWTHEGRWAVICREMMRSGDFFHPYELDRPYYYKPLVSYWLMIGFAQLLGGLDEWALRLPGVVAGLLSVLLTRRLGRRLFGETTGHFAGWMLVGCLFFVYWSRVASSDMLNVAAILAVAAWYAERRDRPGFVTHAGFFLLLGLGGLMKGLIAPVIAILFILPDLLSHGRWRPHLRPSLLPAALIGAAVYLTPYALSTLIGGPAPGTGGGSGLRQAFRETVVSFFKPYDHAEPVYTYFLYLPVYLLPWTLFLPAVVRSRARRWKETGHDEKWIVASCILIFAFLTLSRTRRSYYVLPLLPFTVLFIADVIVSEHPAGGRLWNWAKGAAVACWLGMAVWFATITPMPSAVGGVRILAEDVQKSAVQRSAWSVWQVVLVDAPPAVAFYLDPADQPRRMHLDDPELATFLRVHPRTVLVTRAKHAPEAARMIDDPIVIKERYLPELKKWLGRFAPDENELLVAIMPGKFVGGR